MKMRKVMEERGQRGHEMLYSVSKDQTVRDIAIFMCDKKIGAVMVFDPAKGKDQLCGIISERDIIISCAAKEDPDKVLGEAIMSTDLVVADINDEADKVITIMAKKHIRHIPIMADKKVVSLISVRDILHSLELEHEITITHMSDYLSSTHLNQVY